MEKQEKRHILGFYENELTNNLLFYWLPRCEDKEFGGFINCFDSTGKTLMSTDKYTWSQGRFVWIFATLATMKSDTFCQNQKEEFKRLARQGRDFLKKHCLLGENDWRCVYLMNREGVAKHVDGYDVIDASIYADCFVVNAFAKVAKMDKNFDDWIFAKSLYCSIKERLDSGTYHTLPYPLEHCYRAHGIPMIMTNVAKEMYDAAIEMEKSYCEELKNDLRGYTLDTMENFVDDNYKLREVIYQNNQWVDGILGTHINPGHVIENIWFILDAMKIDSSLNTSEMLEKLVQITLNALKVGWDDVYGGIFHYADYEGGALKEKPEDYQNIPVLHYALTNTSGKIWWVHSEALYTILRLYIMTGKEEFWRWYKKIEAYVFEKFPNRDREVREWIQSLDRQGKMKQKAVGLPVKDPYHIMRNVILIIELLYEEVNGTEPGRDTYGD